MAWWPINYGLMDWNGNPPKKTKTKKHRQQTRWKYTPMVNLGTILGNNLYQSCLEMFWFIPNPRNWLVLCSFWHITINSLWGQFQRLRYVSESCWRNPRWPSRKSRNLSRQNLAPNKEKKQVVTTTSSGIILKLLGSSRFRNSKRFDVFHHPKGMISFAITCFCSPCYFQANHAPCTAITPRLFFSRSSSN